MNPQSNIKPVFIAGTVFLLMVFVMGFFVFHYDAEDFIPPPQKFVCTQTGDRTVCVEQ